MQDQRTEARLAAMWILNVASCVKLLRAHGRAAHAANFEAALDELVEIVAADVGRERLTEAMNWITDRTWRDPEGIEGVADDEAADPDPPRTAH